MEHRSYYALIPANVRYDSELMPNAKLLYGEITALCNEKGYCWASDKYFSDLYNVSKTTVQNWLKSLYDKGYITREIIYKEGTKEILHRYIKILEYPYTRKLEYPIQENLRDNNTLINNTSSTYVEETTDNSLEKVGFYSDIDRGIFQMKSDTSWKSTYGKQAGIKNPNDCDAWIDRYRDHAIASGKNSSTLKDLKSHCLNWTRKRINAGDVIQRKMTEAEKNELRNKRFSS